MDYVAEYATVELGAFEYQSNPWNKGDLRYGLDYAQRLGKSPTAEALRLHWMWPKEQADISAYPGFILGMKPWSDRSTTPHLPAPIASLTDLAVAIDLDWDAGQSNFNVAFDLWIADAIQNGPDVVLNEVMIWVKPWDWPISDSSAATYADQNGVANIYHRANHEVGSDTWQYTAVIYQTAIRQGRIDLDDVLGQLVDLGYLDPTHYLMDIELGAEVVSGTGWLDIRELRVSFGEEAETLVTPEVLAPLRP